MFVRVRVFVIVVYQLTFKLMQCLCYTYILLTSYLCNGGSLLMFLIGKDCSFFLKRGLWDLGHRGELMLKFDDRKILQCKRFRRQVVTRVGIGDLNVGLNVYLVIRWNAGIVLDNAEQVWSSMLIIDSKHV